ncbi:hypothetical protein WA026_004409 [Henosepilachna vigintioctopunctata]|uniref:Uncharacterized protein n=1 Tax=Henosepilachna vigintioctopunctata TaxID=420089 RepID=A0AAW1VB84_9CUCU
MVRTEGDLQYGNSSLDEVKWHDQRLITQNEWSLEESATVPVINSLKTIDIILSTTANKSETTNSTNNSVEVFKLTEINNKPYMESTDFREEVAGSEQDSMSYSSSSNDYDIENEEPHSNIKKNSDEEAIDMEFENIFDDLIQNGNNLNYMTSNGSKRQPKSVGTSFNLDDSDVHRNYETDYEKYKSPGIESASLVVEGKTSHKVVSGTTTNANAQNRFTTTKLLTSNIEVNKESSFVISKSDSRKRSQLELQDDGLSKSTSTHEDAVSRLATDETIYVLPPLIVELAEGNSLWLNPNVRQDLYYEVTNNLNSAVQIRFKVTDERSILWAMDKYNVYLSPHDTTRVRLTVIPRVDVDTDRIVFNAMGAETVHKEVVVHVSNRNTRSDDSPPLLDYSYTSDCTDVGFADCHKGTWTIKVSARDQGCGLMLLTTVPKGIYFHDGYTAGTTEEVTGYFSDTCCNPDLQIIAVDSRNNRIVKQANAYSAPLSFWAIIAIVLAVLIILVIIIVIVIYCVKKYKESQTGSFDLPTYRGRSRF